MAAAPKAGLIGTMFGWGGNPIYQAVRAPLQDLGYGLSRGKDWQEGVALAAEQSARMAPYRSEQQQRQEAIDKAAALRTQYAEMLNGMGPEYASLAEAVGMGAIEPAQAFKGMFDIQGATRKEQEEAAHRRANAQFLTDPELRSMVESGALDFETAYKHQQTGPDAPTITEIYDPQTGLPQKGYMQGNDFVPVGGPKAPSNGLRIINNPDGSTEIIQGGPAGRFDNTVDTEMGKQFAGIQAEALSAMRGLNTLSAMEQAMQSPGFYSGFGSQQVMDLKRAAAAIGIDPEGVTSMETFNALAKQSALDVMGGSLGTGFSNADRDFVIDQVANLGNTPEGNRKLIEIQRKIAERKIEIARLAEQYRLANGKVDGGFVDVLAQWSDANPLFGAAGGGDPLGILGGF